MKWLSIALLGLIACSPSVEKPAVSATAPATAPERVTTSAPPAVIAEQNITITGVEVANPLVISGTARTFENNVVLRARAADGTLIAEGFTTATGEMGQHSPYRGSLWLTRLPGPRVLVEALEYSAKDGAEINLASTEQPFDVAPVEAVLYFPDASCTAVKPYTRPVPKTLSHARLLVEALVAGPTPDERKRGAAVAFPEGSGVRSVILRGGVVTVDFNERLQSVGGSCRTEMIREAVTQTLQRLPAVKKVVITAGGSEELALQP